MKTKRDDRSKSRMQGWTLIEITLVIGITLTLASIVTFSVSSTTEWKEGRLASEKLKTVYLAQKGYLADHPTEKYTDLTSEILIPYLPGNEEAFPEQKSLEGEALTLDFQIMPPLWQLSSSPYDPSGSGNDGLWDVGRM